MFSPPSPDPGSGLAIGLDLGTSGMKAVAIDRTGTTVARASATYPTHRPEPGASEQTPADWISAVIAVARDLREQTDHAPWSVIGLSAMLPTLVIVEANGEPVGSAITWEDARAEAEGDLLRDAVGAEHLYSRTGQWVDGRYLLPMAHRWASPDPAHPTEPSRILGAKDFLFAWLTGTAATDPSTAAGYGAYALAEPTGWDSNILAVFRDVSGIALDLPRILPTHHLEPLTDQAALALGLSTDTLVCLGAADSVLGAVGMGVTAGHIAYVGGTSTIVLGVTDTVVVDEAHRFLVTPMQGAHQWGLEMDLLATGAAFRWLAGVLGLPDEGSVLALAATANGEPPVFLPYVAPGEQGALWDPHLTGTLDGLHLGHGAPEICRALVNGIVVESMRCFSALDDHGFDAAPVTVSGGSASDPWFAQQLADASGRTVGTCLGSETDRSALGAAMVAAEALGWEPAAPLSGGAVFLPDPLARSAWVQLAEHHDSVLARIRARA